MDGGERKSREMVKLREEFRKATVGLAEIKEKTDGGEKQFGEMVGLLEKFRKATVGLAEIKDKMDVGERQSREMVTLMEEFRKATVGLVELNGVNVVLEKELKEHRNATDTHPLPGERWCKQSPEGGTPELPTNQPNKKKMYDMSRSRRGVALIFNMLKPHEGGEKDTKALEETLEKLNFEINSYDNKTGKEILEILDKAASQDHEDADCFLVAMTSHGKENGVIITKDGGIKIEDVWMKFLPDNVPSLTGKPKIFLFDSCRGTKKEKAVLAKDAGTSPISLTPSIPLHADFCIVYSSTEGYITIDDYAVVTVCNSENSMATFDEQMFEFRKSKMRLIRMGYVSYSQTGEGSWLIQDLCGELKKNADKRDFISILTLALGRVAHTRESGDVKKQMPVVLSTLTKFIYF